MDLETYQRHGLHNPFGGDDCFIKVVNGRSNQEIQDALATSGDQQYHPCPEAYPDAEVPKGHLTCLSDWSDSNIYPDTQRDIWIYTPSQFKAHDDPPAIMVFNDGEWYLDQNGPVRATNVLDTLIHSGEISITIGVFVMPGRPMDVESGTDLTAAPDALRQRLHEYDSCTNTYVRFLQEDCFLWWQIRSAVVFLKIRSNE